MSETPDTQKAMWESLRYNQDERLSLTFENRDLSEELFAAQNERDEALSQIVQAECRAERFCQERDEAREKYATEATEHMLAINKLATERDDLERERDEARGAAHSFRSFYYAKTGINRGGCAFPWEETK